MRFCSECGGALNLFETNDDNVCWSCVRKKEPIQPVPASRPLDADDLAEAVLYHKDNTLILKAKEGWVLWSGPDTDQVSLATIMERARRIHEIRKKRQQKQTDITNP